MTSYFLLTLTFVLMALFTCQQTLAAAIGDQEQCIKLAYKVYDLFTLHGCDVKLGEKACSDRFSFAIENLNADLDKCERSDYVTLCYIKPDGGLFSSGCSVVKGNGKLTKAECQTRASEDFTFNGADGSKVLFEAKNTRCINTIDYNCIDLCK